VVDVQLPPSARSDGMTVLCGSDRLSDALEGAATGLAVLAAEIEVTDATAVDPWLVEAPVRLLDGVRQLLADEAPRLRVAVAVVVHEAGDPFAAAIAAGAVEALRGAVQSLTHELGSRAAINIVIARPGELEPLRSTLAFLASEDASYLAGATLDLRGAP
jgi:hypothetical protein